MADMEGSQFVTDDEINDYLNRAGAYWHDTLTTTYEDYFLTYGTATVSGTNYITLPDDFLKLRGLDWSLDSTNQTWRTLRQFDFRRRNDRTPDVRRLWGGGTDRMYRLVQGVIWLTPETGVDGTYRYWYLQRYQPMITDSDQIADWQGWDELVTIDAAIKCLQKEESDVSLLMADREATLRRIEAAASNRSLDPETTSDVQREGSPAGWGDPWGA